jgi:small subunit ribosomal protein S7
MSREGKIKKFIKEPDFKYKSSVVTKFINMVMLDGKKSIARDIVYETIENLEKEDIKEARKYFEDAIKNVMPQIEVRTRRVGGANYQIPIPVKHDRSETLAIRWILDSARNKKGKPMVERLTNEIKLAFKNEGEAIQKKVNTHKMADANKAFAHFRW